MRERERERRKFERLVVICGYLLGLWFNGKLRMENGKWKVENFCAFSVFYNVSALYFALYFW